MVFFRLRLIGSVLIYSIADNHCFTTEFYHRFVVSSAGSRRVRCTVGAAAIPIDVKKNVFYVFYYFYKNRLFYFWNVFYFLVEKFFILLNPLKSY